MYVFHGVVMDLYLNAHHIVTVHVLYVYHGLYIDLLSYSILSFHAAAAYNDDTDAQAKLSVIQL